MEGMQRFASQRPRRAMTLLELVVTMLVIATLGSLGFAVHQRTVAAAAEKEARTVAVAVAQQELGHAAEHGAFTSEPADLGSLPEGFSFASPAISFGEVSVAAGIDGDVAVVVFLDVDTCFGVTVASVADSPEQTDFSGLCDARGLLTSGQQP